MMHNRVDIIRDAYEAFARGDMDALRSLFRDTEWIESDGMPFGGRYQGSEEVIEKVFGPLSEDVEGFSARPDELLAAGDDRVLAMGRYRGKGSNGDLDVGFAHVWTVREGKITKFVQYADTHEYRQAVGR